MKLKKLVLMSLVTSMVLSVPTYAKSSKYSDDWYEQWGQQIITISEDKLILYKKGDTEDKEFELTVDMEEDEDIKWESSDEKVATVTSKGVVKARKAGTCTIYARGKESEKYDTCSVEVKTEYIPVEEAKVTKDGEVTVSVSKKVKLPFQLTPEDHMSVKYFSTVTDSSICSVDSDGYVTGREEGETTVYLYFSNDEKGEDPITSLSQDEAEFVLKFTVTVEDYDTEALDDFSEQFEGFRINQRKEVDSWIWVEVNDVGWILYDTVSGGYASGWNQVGSKWYYLEKKEVKAKNTSNKTVKSTMSVLKTGWHKDGENWYLLGPDGDSKYGWQYVDGHWYYLDTVTRIMKTNLRQIGDKYYYLRSDGAAIQGWYHDDANNVWYYGDPVSCELPCEWFLVDGKWYYADQFNRYILTNKWVKDSQGYDYYLGGDGSMLVDCQTPDGYYVGTDGRWIQ